MAARRRRRRLALIELAAAATLIATLAAINQHRAEPPLSADRLWEARADSALDALSLDVARASRPAPTPPNRTVLPRPGSIPAERSVLRGAAIRLRRLGAPPGTAAAAAWASALSDVVAASSAAGPRQRLLLDEAGLALVRLELALRVDG